MRPSTSLSSAVFQLTPTRTRCDLIIIANEKKEKIASGLVNPFVAHLKTAQDQIAKGGYSILLQPENSSDAAWFTKATLERFVRFVSTPEILERVYTIETEILQIEEAIALQRSNDASESIVENHKRKSLGGFEGDKSVVNVNEEKAIVLYTPGAPSHETNGSCSQEGNSKVELLKVLETRKTLLRKEQGMAFARAVAAGFDIDHIAPLVSFADCFGATRLMEACSRFMNLWKSKHETGQWLDIEASEALSARSDFNASGIMLSTTPNKYDESNHEMSSENNGKSGSISNSDNPVPNGQQEYFQGQFPHLVFPPWPMHAPPGAQPAFQAYPMQGMPYYGPFFQPHHYPMEHSPSQDARGSNTRPETREIDRTRSLDDDMALDTEVSPFQKQRKKSGGSKKQSGMVVIRNINYITSKEKKSGSETNSDSDSDIDTEDEYSEHDGSDVIHHNDRRSSRSGGKHLKSVDKLKFNNNEVPIGKDTDDRHWQAFQDCLLRGNDEDANAVNRGMFGMEKNVKIKRHTNAANDDILSHGADNNFSGTNYQTDTQFAGSNGKKILSRSRNEDYMIASQRNSSNFRDSLDPLALSGQDSTNRIDRDFSHGLRDETLIVPFGSMSLDQVGGTHRTAIDMDSEVPSKYQKLESEANRNRLNYQPNDLNLIPERGTDQRSTGYDHALDYEMQANTLKSEEKRKKGITDVKAGLKKSDKDRRAKVNSDSLNKQRAGGPIRKNKQSKLNPLEDARARAEKLRSYKADLQKMKKEQEEAEAKRLESLKLERQKRIAARGSSSSVKPSALSPQTKQLPAKLSSATNRGSKFSDSEPGSSSPLQRSKIRAPLISSESNKASKASKLSEGARMTGNRLTRSSSSLSETKRETSGVTPDSKASLSRIRRLSEPKKLINPPVSTVKARSADTVLKRKSSEGPDRNKISAIINLDKSKAATLPELKIKTSKPHVNIGEKRSAVKDGQKANGSMPSMSPVNGELHVIDADDNPIVEKSVVVLECEKPSVPNLYASQGKPEASNQPHKNQDIREKNCAISESATRHALRPPVDGVHRAPVTSQLQKQPDYNEVRTAYSDKDPVKVANKAEKPYEAPYARVSSLEDPCTHQSEYGKAPLVSSELLHRAEGTVRTHVPDVKTTLKMDKNQALSEKNVVKESSRGLRRLLKFGKKNHSSSSVDQSIDSECASAHGVEHDAKSRRTASTSEVHTLKNLISQDETSSNGSAPQKTEKASRHFSLLSPFRLKKLAS